MQQNRLTGKDSMLVRKSGLCVCVCLCVYACLCCTVLQQLPLAHRLRDSELSSWKCQKCLIDKYFDIVPN